MAPEKQTQSPNNPELPKEVDQSRIFSVELDGVRNVLGDVPPPLPAKPTDQELQEITDEDRKKRMESFWVFCQRNEALWLQTALQLELGVRRIEDDLQEKRLPPLSATDPRKIEQVVADQAITYNQYLPVVVRSFTAFMDRFEEEFHEVLPNLGTEEREALVEQRRQAIFYMKALKDAMQERLHYATIFDIDAELAEIATMPAQAPHRKELQTERAKLVKLLSPATVALLEKEAMLKQMVTQQDRETAIQTREKVLQLRKDHNWVLSNRIIDILKGNPEGKHINGVPKDFFPQMLLLSTIKLRSYQLREIQIRIANDESWNEQDRKEAQEFLSKARKEMMDVMIAITQQLAAHHMAVAELTMIQNHFGKRFDLENPRSAVELFTSEEDRKKIHESIDGAKKFHLERLQAMLNRVDTSFNPNGLESLKDATQMGSIKAVDFICSFIRTNATRWIPEGKSKETIESFLDKNLQLAIQESLETGVGPDGQPLTKEQKLQAVRDVLLRFRDGGSVAQFRETLTTIEQMPDSATFMGEEVREPLPVERVTSENKDQFIQKYNGATVYAMLARQMEQDGDTFHGEYKKFLNEMEQLLDIRLGLIAEKNLIKEGWGKLWKSIAALAGASFLAPFVAGAEFSAGAYLLWKLPRILKATVRLPGTLARYAKEVPGKLRNAVQPSRLAFGTGTVLSAWRTYEDIKELLALNLSIETQRTQIITELLAAGFEEDSEIEGRYVYKDGGVEVAVRVDQLQSARNPELAGKAVAAVGHGTQTAVLALMWAGKITARVGGPIVLSVEVAVESVVYGMDQLAQRRFIARCPAWLLAKINLEGAMGYTPYEMMAKGSEWMATDVMEGSEGRTDMRKKMLFALLNQELSESNDLRREVYGGSTHPMQLEQFWGQDFNEVFLKLYHLRLFQNTGGKYSWEEIKQNKLDGYNIPSPLGATPKIPHVEVRRALREAAVLYSQHTREKYYLLARDALADAKDPQVKAILLDAVKELGKQKVIGKSLGDVEVLPSSSQTRMQRILEYLYTHETTVVPKGFVPGLGEDMDFAEENFVYESFVDDSALRMRLARVTAVDIGEVSGREGMRWYDWKPYTKLKIGIGKTDTMRSLAIAAADNIRKELARTKLSIDPTVLTPITASGKESSKEYASERITRDAIDLFQRSKEVSNRRTSFTRAPSYEERLEKNFRARPYVFTSNGHISIDLCAQLAQKRVIGADVSPEDLRAVFFEEKSLRQSGETLVLATYVYGHPEKGKVLLLRCAATYAMLNGMLKHDSVAGELEPVAVSEAAKSPVITQMLDRLLREQEAAKKLRQENREREEHEWREGAPQREKKSKLQKTNIRAAQERIKKHPWLIGYVPTESNTQVDRFQMSTGDGAKVEFDTGLSEGPAFRSADDKFETDNFVFIVTDSNGKKMKYSMNINSLKGLNKDFSREDLDLCRRVLTTPLDLTGHPRVADKKYAERVRRYEIDRILDMVEYKGSYSWNAREFHDGLMRELWPYYRDAKDKRTFLNTLLNNLLENSPVTGGTFSSTYGTILSRMKKKY